MIELSQSSRTCFCCCLQKKNVTMMIRCWLQKKQIISWWWQEKKMRKTLATYVIRMATKDKKWEKRLATCHSVGEEAPEPWMLTAPLEGELVLCELENIFYRFFETWRLWDQMRQQFKNFENTKYLSKPEEMHTCFSIFCFTKEITSKLL